MYKKLKYTIIFSVLSIGFLILSGILLVTYSKYAAGPLDFNTLSASEFKKNDLVEGDLYLSFGYFAEEYTTKNGVKTSTDYRYYIIPVGKEEYMAVCLPHDMFKEMETLCDKTEAYMSYATDDLPEPIHLIGKIEKMDKEIEGYLNDWLNDTDWFGESENVSDYIVPYKIQKINPQGIKTNGLVLGGIGLVLLIIAVIFLIFTIKSAKLKKSSANSVNSMQFLNGNSNEQQFSYQPDDSSNQNSDPQRPEKYDENQKPPCEL